MDAFYASVEQREHPELRGLPVLVGGTGNRGVVAAASYEARRFGIRSAMPTAEARRLCPEAVFLRPRFALYKESSRKIFTVFREFTDDVEGLSLDEAFLDLGVCRDQFDSVRALAVRIKDRIREETGLSASVGVGPNKLVAKIASDLDKPDGLCVLFGDDVRAALDPLPARAIGGVGPRTAERLAQIGVLTVKDLRQARDRDLDRVFGRYAQRMRNKARGIDDRPVSGYRADQSISAEETFDSDLADAVEVRNMLSGLTARVAARAHSRDLVGSVVTIKIRRADFRTFTRQRRISPPLSDAPTLERIASGLLSRWFEENTGARIRLLGVGISGLGKASQLGLFDAVGPCTGDGVKRAPAEPDLPAAGGASGR
jgi:DNA polymerase-4